MNVLKLAEVIYYSIHKGTKYRYIMHLKSPRVHGVKIWDMLPATVQKATTKVKFKLLIKKICRTI